MNPAWLPGIIASVGFIGNIIWTVLNLQMRADIAKQIADLKEWMSSEYVTRKEWMAADAREQHHGRD
jgi:hypothetical protein